MDAMRDGPPELRFSRREFLRNELPLTVGFLPNHRNHAPHTHAFWELVIVRAGSARHRLGDHEETLQAGHVFAVLPHECHSYHAAHELSLINILFDLPALIPNIQHTRDLPAFAQLIPPAPQDRPRRAQQALRLKASGLKRAVRLAEQIRHVLRGQAPGRLLLAHARFLELITLVAQGEPHTSGASTVRHPQIERIIQCLEREYPEPITMQTLLDLSTLTHTTLYQHFRDATGGTPMEYLLQVRMRHARNLLRSTRLPMSEIAVQIGLPDSNYFARLFRQHHGMPPTQFRRHG